MDMKEKKKDHASSQRRCMSGKGGPENAMYRYKGVRQRSWGKWVAEIHDRKQGKRHWLGSYDNASQAALVYDIAAQRLYGVQAKLNLPEFWDRLAQCLDPNSELNITQLTDNERHLLNVLQKCHGKLMHPSRVHGQNLPLENMVPHTEIANNEKNKNLSESIDDNMREVWDNLNLNMPVVNNYSIWDEVAMSSDFSSFTEFDFSGDNIDSNKN